MRILIVHSRYLSGPASGENRVVEDEARLLKDGGHQVQVWDPAPSNLRGLDLIRTGASAIWSRHAVHEVRELIRNAGIELLHSHNLFPLLSPAVFRVAKSEGIPVFQTLHNYRLICLPATFVRDGRPCEDCLGHVPLPGVLHRCYRRSYLGSAAIALSLGVHRGLGTFRLPTYLAVSKFVRQKYVAAGWAPDCIKVKSNFAWPTPRREGAGDYFLYVGRLSPEKGLSTLLEAWRGLRARLIVLGDGPQAPALKAQAPPGVTFRGTVEPSEISEVISRARALLLPSLCYEAQPRSILEAYSAGVPVLASHLGALPELVLNGVSGLLVPPGNPGAWIQTVHQLLDDGEAERLGDGAWQLWRDRYTPEAGLASLESIYTQTPSSRDN